MMPAQGPVLRDIHLPAEPGWWPPAPGWWVLAALLLLVLGLLLHRWLHRRRLARARAELLGELDALLAQHRDTPAGRLAAMSMLLRRAGKRYAPAMHAAQGDAWLAFLDGDDPGRPFSSGAGRLLLEGPFRRQVDDADVDAVTALVRRRLPQFVGRADV